MLNAVGMLENRRVNHTERDIRQLRQQRAELKQVQKWCMPSSSCCAGMPFSGETSFSVADCPSFVLQSGTGAGELICLLRNDTMRPMSYHDRFVNGCRRALHQFQELPSRGVADWAKQM